MFFIPRMPIPSLTNPAALPFRNCVVASITFSGICTDQTGTPLLRDPAYRDGCADLVAGEADVAQLPGARPSTSAAFALFVKDTVWIFKADDFVCWTRSIQSMPNRAKIHPAAWLSL